MKASGPYPIIAIGGTLCDNYLWNDVQATFHPIVAGCLPSGQIGTALTMKDHAAELLAALPQRFSLVGFSLGGLIALEIIAQAPHRVSGLALICAGAGPESDGSAINRRNDEIRAREIGLKTFAAHSLAPRYGLGQNSQLVSIIGEMAERVGMELYQLQNSLAITRTDSRPRLKNMHMPVHLVSGENDLLCPPHYHQEIVASFPDARMTVIKNCGHMVPLVDHLAVSSVFSSL